VTTQSGAERSGSLGPPGRAELTRHWAKVLRATAYVPASHREVERLLRELLDHMFDSLVVAEFSPNPGWDVGQRLVAGYFTGEHSLSCTVEVLGQAFLAHPELREVETLGGKVVSLLGAVAAGYATALRIRTLDQQEKVKQALLKAGRDAERGWQVSEAKFRQLFTSSAVGIAISNLDGDLVEINQALRGIVGDVAAGHCLYALFHADDVAPLRVAYQGLVAGRSTGFRLPQRIRLIDRHGESAWTYLAVSLLRDADDAPTHQVTIVEDVTELHLLGQELRHQSLHDVLTGLPNQQFFMSRLGDVLERAGPASRTAVCKIDLDGLAAINDGFGRATGDRVLRAVAARLQSVVTGNKATVARFGSDEFAILLENSPASATLASHVSSTFAEPVSVDGTGLVLSGCVGVVEHQGRGMEATEVLRAAEAALHSAKSSGRHQWELFDAHRDADHRVRCRLAAAMHSAWRRDEISLDYQPLVRIADSAIVGVQALLRWDHSRNGSLSHQECLALAARTGLTRPLGHWLLRGACAQLASWQQRFGELTLLLHVDITPQQYCDPDLVGVVRDALEQAGLAPERLQLGIPVSALDAGPGEGADNLAELGVAIGLLGFSGVADIAHLEDLPVRTVEIASDVAARVARRPGEGSAVARVVPLILEEVHCFGATVLVRGIDTQSKANWWGSAGADVGQGTFLGPPATPDETVTRLRFS
jgi:diguanylate cyclase (GGDEF)-like protein/PAS domain S-box-containing protein